MDAGVGREGVENTVQSGRFEGKVGERRSGGLTKRVIDAGRIIAHAFGRPVADEDAACILHCGHDGLGVLDLEDQVFGGVVIAPVHSFLDILDDESDGVLDGAADDVLSREGVGLRVQLGFDGGELLVVQVDGE